MRGKFGMVGVSVNQKATSPSLSECVRRYSDTCYKTMNQEHVMKALSAMGKPQSAA